MSDSAEDDLNIICVCCSTHENDFYPEQCPICEIWYIGQCASDNLLYTYGEIGDSVPYSCIKCDSAS